MGLKNFLARIVGRKLSKSAGLKEDSEMEMEGTKKWFQSKTVWSGVLVVAMGTYELVKQQFAPNLPEIPGWLLSFLGGFGIYGRVSAKKEVA